MVAKIGEDGEFEVVTVWKEGQANKLQIIFALRRRLNARI
jgi:hypothetical protein